MKKYLMLFLMLFGLAFTFACNEAEKTDDENQNDNNEENEVKVQGITVSSKNDVRVIKADETLELTAIVYPEGVSQEVVWSSSDSNVATVSENGLVTGVNKGNVKITATSKVDEKISKEFLLTIEEKEEVVINPESIEIINNDNVTELKAGESLTLSAVVSPKEANQSIEWSVSDSEIASVKRGVVTALKEGTVEVTAIAKGFEDVKDTITIKVNPSDNQVLTKDWPNMSYSTHEEYMTVDEEAPLKVKGVVTYVFPVSENKVTYLIQNGTEGYYVYAQDNAVYPVELGKVYEVGGFKKYYRGLNEIVNVEYFRELDESISYTVNSIESINPSVLEEANEYQASFVSGKAVLVSASINDSKAYSFTAKVNGYETTFRVDPSQMSSEEFASINAVLSTAVVGSEFDFVGFMSAFGYGKASPQIQIVRASDLGFAELSDEEILEVAKDKLDVKESVSASVNEIVLPTTVEGFEGVEVTWLSDNAAIDVNTGVVTHGSSNVSVKLTATLYLNGKTLECVFEVVVIAIDNTEYEVIATLDLEDASREGSWGNSETKPSYAAGTVELGTPKYTWLLQNALIASTSSDKVSGDLAIRAQAGKSASETARVEVRHDDEYNAVEFDAAIYGNDAVGLKIRIEYSFDAGSTWQVCDEIITVEGSTLETFRVKLPEGVKRVAIVVVENSGRRVNLDNIKLMK